MHFMKFLIIIINDDDVSISLLICIKMILTHVVLKFFNFPNACKIELHALREAGTFIRVDTEMCLHPAYIDNPVTG